MKACFMRILACIAGILIGGFIFGVQLSFGAGCLMALMLSVMYILLRPIMQLIALLFNIFLFGILTVASDALFVLWAAAWTPGVMLVYWQAAVIAAIILAAHIGLERIFRNPAHNKNAP